jgi:hypothetical protein
MRALYVLGRRYSAREDQYGGPLARHLSARRTGVATAAFRPACRTTGSSAQDNARKGDLLQKRG